MSEKKRGGRPLGWRKGDGVRPQHQLRAYADEWLLIQEFAYFVKHKSRNLCRDALNQIKSFDVQ